MMVIMKKVDSDFAGRFNVVIFSMPFSISQTPIQNKAH
jgi:hypothetical protein